MKFITQFDDEVFHIDSEVLDKDSLFEFGTYRDTKTQVEEFIYAGKRLEAARSSQFDDINDSDDFSIDPTRSKNFDLVDASDIINRTNEAITNAIVEQKKAKKSSEALTTEPIKSETEKLAESALES